MIEQSQDEAVNRIRALLGEHFINFAFAVMDEEGELYYDYANFRIGKMLFTESLEDMEGGSLCDDDEWTWDDEWEDDDYE
jgi:hypothetical protein